MPAFPTKEKASRAEDYLCAACFYAFQTAARYFFALVLASSRRREGHPQYSFIKKPAQVQCTCAGFGFGIESLQGLSRRRTAAGAEGQGLALRGPRTFSRKGSWNSQSFCKIILTFVSAAPERTLRQNVANHRKIS